MPRWLAYSLLACGIWGAWGLIPKATSPALSDAPLLMQAVSTAGLVPVALLLLFSPGLRAGTKHGRGAAAAFASGLAASVGNIALLESLKRGGQASLVYPLTGIYPLVTVLLAFAFLRERLNRVQGGGFVLALVALVLMNLLETEPGEASWRPAPWMLYAGAALVLYGVAGFAQKIATAYVSNELCTVAFALGFAVVAGLILAAMEPLRPLDARDLGLALFWGALSGAGGLALFAAYRWGKASVVTAVTALYPALTASLAVPLFGESVGALKVVAVALAVSAGIALTYERGTS